MFYTIYSQFFEEPEDLEIASDNHKTDTSYNGNPLLPNVTSPMAHTSVANTHNKQLSKL
jgi:hypothetical protein